MENIKEKGVRNKLCLKKKILDSSQDTIKLTNYPKNKKNTEGNCINEQAFYNQNGHLSSYDNDSLEDFKSPKIKTKPKTDLNQFKFNNDKDKKKIEKTKNKLNTKRKNTNLELNQPLIESSLLKPQIAKQNEIIESIPCPLCLKGFKDDSTCTNHMKICAVKNNISTKQLLVAMQLQSRQAKERKAMGLLAAPILPERKKTYRTKNYSTEDDPELQLVLAMSESLYQAEQVAELKETALLAGVPPEYIKELSSQDCRTTLQSFGFTTNKTADPPKQKKRKLHGPTILQSRSKEDKDRVLTERIACILTGDDAFTQILRNTESLYEKRPTVLRSEKLKKIEVLNNKLWDRSRLTKKYNDFYVKELKLQILQTNEQVKEPVSTNSEHLLNNEKDEADTNIDLIDCSIVYEPINIDTFDQNNSQIDRYRYSHELNEKERMDCELNFRKTIVSNWREILNNKSTSDVIIVVKNNKNIYAHKLVFHVQCPNILVNLEHVNLDNSSQVKEKICWFDKDELSALAFLEFIYCGSIDKNISVFDQDNLVVQIENLAMLYQVKDLFIYIRRKVNDLGAKRLNKHNSEINVFNETRINNNFSEIQLSQTTNVTTNYSSDPTTSLKKLEIDNKTCRILSKEDYNIKRITISPDLFASESEDENLYLDKVKENDHIPINNYNTKDIKVYEIKDKLNNEEYSDSEQTVVNLSCNSSPQSDKSSILISKRDLHEQVTPKKFNDDNIESIQKIDIKSEKSPSNDEEIYAEETQCEKDNSSEHMKLIKNTSIKIDNIITKEIDNNCETEDNFLHNAVTPPKSEIKDFKLTRTNLDKIKTNLSLFIEKVQRENAKSISDSESDIETPNFQIKHRNPFLKVDQHDSYEYLRNDGPKSQKEKNYKQKRIISLLEKDVLEGECKKTHKLSKKSDAPLDTASNLNFDADIIDKFDVIDSNKNENFYSSFSKTNGSNLDLTQSNISKASIKNNSKKYITLSTYENECKNVTDDEVEISRYSKYKQSNQHNNSIKKYRDQILFNLNQNNDDKFNKNESYHNTLTDVSANIKSQNNILKSSTDTEDITLVSESEDDEQNNVKSVESKKTKCDQQYLNLGQKENDKSNFISDHKIYNIEDNNTIPLHVYKEQQQSKISKTVSSSILKSNLDSKVIDLSLDSDEENIYEKNTIENNLEVELNNLLKNKKITNKEMEFKILDQINNEDEAELSKIVDLSPEFDNIDNILPQMSMSNEKLNTTGNTINDNKSEDGECKVINLSPISIISSPENYEYNKTAINSSEKDEPKTGNDDFDDFECNDDWLTRFSEKSKSCNIKKKLSFENIYSKNEISPKLNLVSLNTSTSQRLKIQSLISSPILTKDGHCSQPLCSNLSKCNKNDQSKNGSSFHAFPENRKLKIKSASAMNFIDNGPKSNKSSFQKSASFVTPEQNKKVLRKSSTNKKDITPPLNYSVLETPDLHKELKKFGLKPQNRNKAKILLRHIYNETHPALSSKRRTSSCNSSSEDEEPPFKKQHIEKSHQRSPLNRKHDLELGRDSENCPFIAEEMDYDDNDTASTLDNLTSIKDVFFKLIEANKDLYNKILTYEPLSLEFLHSLIKQKGLKIKMNSLMNFLDEQCITFQVQNSNGSRTKKNRNQKDHS